MKTIKHPPFLAKVMQHVRASDRLGKRLFVFPTQLSIDYFQTLLSKETWKASATCLTLDQWMLANSSIAPPSTYALLDRLYRLAQQILNIEVSFEAFYDWGLPLLKDFNDIENYLVNGADLLLSCMQQKEQAIHAFVGQGTSAFFKSVKALSLVQQKESLVFYQQIPLLYASFREKLLEERKGYAGLCYRMAQPSPKIIDIYKEVILVGFNGLTPAQVQFVSEYQIIAPVRFFWDVDGHYLNNTINIAGYYLRQHREKGWLSNSCLTSTYLDDPDKKLFLIERASTVAEIQAVVAALREKNSDGHSIFLPNQTAIVVSGSDLLIPLLHAFDNLPIPLHCRLDYPFNATVIYTLVERLVQLWDTSTVAQGQQEACIQMADLLALCDPFIDASLEKGGGGDTLYRQGSVFDPWANKEDKGFLGYIKGVCTYLGSHFIESDHLLLTLHKKSLDYLLTYIDVLAEMDTCSTSFFLNGLKESRVVFQKYNPETGLYIVDVAQSYNLDFENVFFIGMNEEHFPRFRHDDSFLPYDLRCSFGISSLDKIAENNTAYGFYRLLQRAQNIYCYYVQKNSLDASSEMSRLLLQLTFDSKLKIINTYHDIYFLKRPIAPISIQKDRAVMQLLNRFVIQEGVAESSITPSALISYLSCPLQFYFRYVLKIKQTELLKDGAEAIQLGTLFHDIMAKLYQPFVGRQMDKQILVALKSKTTLQVKQAIAVQKSELNAPILLHALLEKLLERMLALDETNTPFTLLGVEVSIKHSILLDEGIARKICLSGVIDRIDRHNHSIRIVDYKTGLSNSKLSNIAVLFDRTKVKNHKAIFQLVFYTWLFRSLHECDDQQPIIPYLIYIREFFSEDYRPGIFIQQPGAGKKYQRIEDITASLEPFEEGLRALLVEIFNPIIPFTQTEDLEVCRYCPYVGICQRD